MQSELKPCPFCGGNPVAMSRESMPRGLKVFFHCPNCETSGPAYWEKEAKTFADEAGDAAQVLWNRRTTALSDKQAGEVKTCGHLLGRAHPPESVEDFYDGDELAYLRDSLKEAAKERDHFYNQWRSCWAPLTPRSENEKQGFERVLAILKAKLLDGGGIVGQPEVQRAHNDFYRGRRVAFEECATMLRSALVDVPVEPVALIEREVLTELAKHKTATGTVCSPLLKSKFGDKVPLYTRPPHREGEDSAEVKLPAATVIAIRDALIANDISEAYFLLYQAVDPTFCRYEPWANTEATLDAALAATRSASATSASGTSPIRQRGESE